MVLVLILSLVASSEYLGSPKQKHQVSRVETLVRYRSREFTELSKAFVKSLPF